MQRHDPSKIFVRGVNSRLSDADVLAAFAILRYTKSLKKEFAFVTFDNPDKARRASKSVRSIAGQFVECRQAWVDWGPDTRQHITDSRPPPSDSSFGATSSQQLNARESSVESRVPKRLRSGRNLTKTALGNLEPEERAALRQKIGGRGQQKDDRSAESQSRWAHESREDGERSMEEERGVGDSLAGRPGDSGGSRGGRRERGRQDRGSHRRRSRDRGSRSRSPQRRERRESSNDDLSRNPRHRSYSPPSLRILPSSPHSSYLPASPSFSPRSPIVAGPSFSPSSPTFSRASPAFSGRSPIFRSPADPSFSPASPRFSPASPGYYSPASPSFSLASPRYSPVRLSHSPASQSFSPASPRFPQQRSAFNLPARMPTPPNVKRRAMSTRLEEAKQWITGAPQAATTQSPTSPHQATTGSPLTPLSHLEARMSPAPMDAEPEAEVGDSNKLQASVEAESTGVEQNTAMKAAEQASGSIGGFKRGSFVPVEDDDGGRGGRGGQGGEGGRSGGDGGDNGGEDRRGRRNRDDRRENGRRGGRRDSQREGFINEHCRLAVRNLSKACTSDSLLSFAAECGHVQAASVHLNFVGEGMLEYSIIAEADEALRSLNGRLLHGLTVRLERY